MTRWPPLAAAVLALPQVYLTPGKMHCTGEASVVSTVLGSCVSVCLYDPVRRISGINHFVLPASASSRRDLRHGDVAIDSLIAAMRKLRCRIEALEAKIFGGAAVLITSNPDDNVGTRNVSLAEARLAALGIPIVARRTGGKNGLAVRLFTESGEVLVKRVASPLAELRAKA